MSADELLDRPVARLGLSGDFCKKCAVMKLETLREITGLQPEELVSRDGFSYHWLGELADFLGRNGRMDLLQALPGNPGSYQGK